MLIRKRIFFLAFLLAAAQWTLHAESLFVFFGEDAQARVYSADGLKLVAAPVVGQNARTALRVSEKTIVVATDNRLVFLGPDFSIHGALDLEKPLAEGQNAIAIANFGKLLLVASGNALLVVDTGNRQLLQTLNPGFAVGSLAVVEPLKRALVVAAQSAQARYFDLGELNWDGAPFQLPSSFSSMSASPDGSSTIAFGAKSVYDLALLQPASVDDRLSPTSVAKLANVGGGEFLLLRDGELNRGSLNQPGKAVLQRTGVLDIATNTAGTTVFVANQNNRLEALNSSGEVLARLDLPAAPSALAVVGEPTRQTALGALVQAFGNNQLVLPGDEFIIGVQALDANGVPQAGLAVFVANVFPPGQTTFCAPAITDVSGLAILTCVAGESNTAFNIQLTIQDALGRSAPGFTISVLPSGLSDGLNKISGDGAVVPRNSSFSLVVQAVENGSPQPGLPLSVTRIPGDLPVVCPLQVFALADGTATITCAVGNVPVPTVMQITIADNTGRFANFTVTIVPQDYVSDGLSKVSGDNQNVGRSSIFPFPLVVSYLVGGIPVQGAKLTVTTNVRSLVFCPSFVLTDENGVGTIFCSAGFAAGDIFVKIFVTDPEGNTLPEPFNITIVPEGPNFATGIELLSADSLKGTVGDTLVNALRVATEDDQGDRIGGVTVFFSSSENVLFNPTVGVSRGNGSVEISLTLACPPGSGTVGVGLSSSEIAITIPLRINPGPAAEMVIDQGDGQSGMAGERLDDIALAVKITDRCGTRLRRVPVSWIVEPPDAATLEVIVNATDGQGRASTLVRLGNRSGPFQVIAESGELRQVFTVTVTAVPTSINVISGDQQDVPIGQEAAAALAVEVRAADGRPIEGVGIAFVVDQGDGVLTAPFVRSDSQGRGATRFVAGNNPGPVRVLAIIAASQSAAQKLSTANQTSPLIAEFHLRVTGAAPLISSLTFVNGASFRPGWVPGSTGTVFGVNLTQALDGVVITGPAPFPTDLLGVSVSVNGIPAPILGVANVSGQEQINIQVPFEIPAPTKATVILENNGTAVTIPGVSIERAQPGIFEAFLDGRMQAAALHADFSLVTRVNPARRGETILLFLTGLGPTRAPVETNQAGPIPARRTVFDVAVGIDHAGMVNSGAFYAPGLVTVYQTNFVVAGDVESGDRSLNVVAQGVSSKETVIPVE